MASIKASQDAPPSQLRNSTQIDTKGQNTASTCQCPKLLLSAERHPPSLPPKQRAIPLPPAQGCGLTPESLLLGSEEPDSPLPWKPQVPLAPGLSLSSPTPRQCLGSFQAAVAAEEVRKLCSVGRNPCPCRKASRSHWEDLPCCTGSSGAKGCRSQGMQVPSPGSGHPLALVHTGVAEAE